MASSPGSPDHTQNSDICSSHRLIQTVAMEIDSPNAGQNTRPSPRGTASYRRKRAVTACQVCRARRTKCDNLKPSCSFCLKVGATCIQSPVDLSSFDPASLKILEKLDGMEELLKTLSLGTSDDSRVHKTRVVQSPSPEDDVSPLVPVNPGTVLPRTMDEILLWPCFQGLASPYPRHQAGLSPTSQPTSVSASSVLDLEPVRITHLLNSFFDNVHVKNPIFDERATRRLVQLTMLNGIDWSAESCLSLLICALGSIATPFGPSHDTMPGTSAYSSATSFFQAAQKRIGSLLSSDDIIAPQCLFLSGVFFMCTLQPFKAWRFFVQALTHCQQLDFLSRDCQELYTQCQDATSPPSREADSLRQAVYWSVWKSEREMRSGLYLPDFSHNDHGISLYPTFFPTPPAPRSEETGELDPGQQREQRSWYFYLSEISLRRLAGRIGDEIEAMQRSSNCQLGFLRALQASVPSYESQVQGWIDSLPESLSLHAPRVEDDVCRFVLRGHANNVLEMVYWHFLLAHMDTSPLPASSAAQFRVLTQKAINQHVQRLALNEPGYQHRHHGTILMMFSCARSALVLVAVAMHNQATGWSGEHGRDCCLSLPQDWQLSIQSVIGLLDFWSPEVQNFDRVKDVLERALRVINT